MNKIAEKAIGSAGAAVRALNPHVFTTAAAHNAPQVGHYERRQLPPNKNPLVECAKPVGKTLCEVFAAEGKRIRQDAKPLMNHLELIFYAWLLTKYPGVTIWKQALRWKLGNGIWYKPDFAAFVGWTQKPTGLTCWEVKGPHAFRGGLENLKVAASLYPEVRWILVWRECGGWKHQEVLP